MDSSLKRNVARNAHGVRTRDACNKPSLTGWGKFACSLEYKPSEDYWCAFKAKTILSITSTPFNTKQNSGERASEERMSMTHERVYRGGCEVNDHLALTRVQRSKEGFEQCRLESSGIR